MRIHGFGRLNTIQVDTETVMESIIRVYTCYVLEEQSDAQVTGQCREMNIAKVLQFFHKQFTRHAYNFNGMQAFSYTAVGNTGQLSRTYTEIVQQYVQVSINDISRGNKLLVYVYFLCIAILLDCLNVWHSRIVLRGIYQIMMRIRTLWVNATKTVSKIIDDGAVVALFEDAKRIINGEDLDASQPQELLALNNTPIQQLIAILIDALGDDTMYTPMAALRGRNKRRVSDPVGGEPASPPLLRMPTPIRNTTSLVPACLDHGESTAIHTFVADSPRLANSLFASAGSSVGSSNSGSSKSGSVMSLPGSPDASLTHSQIHSAGSAGSHSGSWTYRQVRSAVSPGSQGFSRSQLPSFSSSKKRSADEPAHEPVPLADSPTGGLPFYPDSGSPCVDQVHHDTMDDTWDLPSDFDWGDDDEQPAACPQVPPSPAACPSASHAIMPDDYVYPPPIPPANGGFFYDQHEIDNLHPVIRERYLRANGFRS